MTTRRQMTAQIAEHAGLSRAQAAAALDALQELVTQSIERGDDVQLKGFGTFRPAHRAARMGRNPHTGQPVEIAATVSMRFKPSRALTERLSGSTAPDAA
ncbi:HU family DNA-binding protein [Streptomyces hygroscopicus]|uniref:HU family DNA-binding protein n=1 Tax=Streptomyces hygroscopicus TaxID=1912 RepID=UPI0007C859DE|nr:HU family DNA-binding protein [Streptomyces hygroscopicus]